MGLFTAVRSTTRESADSIATGLRTSFTRFQRADTVKALQDLGINLRYTRQEAEQMGNVNLRDQFVGAYESVRRLSEGLDAVLVTTGWNRNDDVFDRVEVWAARRTPDDKPLNYEHDDNKIVGHIVGSRVTADDGTDLGDETVVDALPAKFHVVTAAVLYKHWQTPELQERMDTLLAEIGEGKWFVSMECLFKGFDYALKAADGTTRVVARNATTAFLSKHLRCFGGSGTHGDSRIGRVLRNIVFSGKGLVRTPANPESVILDAPAASTSREAIAQAFGWVPEEPVNDHERAAVPGFGERSEPSAGVPASALQDEIARALGWEPATPAPC